ncbi:hypothetical protein BC938DRAFT_474605 [Jimgerdemannia flammicorona]|uniref:Uncharacterized protein n=1 Tax=Jimgerdemannia flammicorona TaxID=994334 RepID=A0A433QSB2_9FUNG|nr:hypothetical protein BC938DRAFT_474605 [Jimgerdemannia flammicorona]
MIHNDEWRPEPEISATHQPEHGEVYEEETHAAKHQPQRGPAKRVATGPVRKLTEEEQRLRDIEKYEAHIFYSNRYYGRQLRFA